MPNTYQNILELTDVNLPEDWLQIKIIDMHTGGEPLRVVVSGFPQLKGNSVLEYRRYCKENFDHLRTPLMFEPRGHVDMYGCILTPPNDAEGDFGIIFLHNEGYSTLCGHAIIAITTLAVELKWITIKEGDNILKIDAPCGRIIAFANVANEKVSGVRFHCVPSFVVGLDRIIEVEGIGKVEYDLAYGGAFYASVAMKQHNYDFDLSTKSYQELSRNGMNIKNAVIKGDPEIEHPFETDLSFL